MVIFLIKIALLEAKKSPDHSTQNGAIIVKENDKTIIGLGYNRPPYELNWEDEKYQTRPQKYFYFEHAERNAIFNAVRKGNSTVGSTIVCPWLACADCARAIIEAGIKKIISIPRLNMTNNRWDESITVGDEMLKDCGIIREDFDIKDHKFGIQLLRNGKLMEF